MAVRGTNILITFNMLMDTDIGLFEVIKNKYNDPNVFDNDVLNLNDKLIKGLLQENTSRNPLMIILKDKNEAQANAFYDELMTLEYEQIVKASTATTMVDVIKRFIDAEAGMKISILCSTKLEASIISNIMGNYNPSSYKIIIQSDWKDLDISLNDTLFIKYVDELIEFDNVGGKNIMISDYISNLDPILYQEKKKSPRHEYALLFGTNNEFYIVSIYHYDESYYLEYKGEQDDGKDT